MAQHLKDIIYNSRNFNLVLDDLGLKIFYTIYNSRNFNLVLDDLGLKIFLYYLQ